MRPRIGRRLRLNPPTPPAAAEATPAISDLIFDLESGITEAEVVTEALAKLLWIHDEPNILPATVKMVDSILREQEHLRAKYTVLFEAACAATSAEGNGPPAATASPGYQSQAATGRPPSAPGFLWAPAQRPRVRRAPWSDSGGAV
jgi:hypothetical protein